MISVRQWIALLIVYLLYLLMGAVVFLFIESGHEMETMKTYYKIRRKISLTAYAIEDLESENEVLKSIEELEEYLGKEIVLPRHILKDQMDSIVKGIGPRENMADYQEYPLKNLNYSEIYDNEFDKNLSAFWKDRDVEETILSEENVWTLWNSFFFSFIALTTIGFGHMTPKTEEGQIFFLFYAVIGVPLNGIVFATLADIFATQFIKRIDVNRYESTAKIILDALLYLIPGLLIFFFLPAIVFTFAQEWSYINSFYFSFICLSTIGFGYYVPEHKGWWGSATYPYRIFIFIWILFGLGYLLMIIAFIQKTLRSKQLRTLDRKISKFMKQSASSYAPEDLRQEVKKLATVLRKIDILSQEEAQIAEMIEQRAPSEIATNEDELSELNDKIESPPKVNIHRKAENSIDVFLRIAEKVLQEGEIQTHGIKPSKSDGALSEKNSKGSKGNEINSDLEGVNNFAYEGHGEAYTTVTSLPEHIIHRPPSSIWSDNEVLPHFPDENELQLPDTLSNASKGSIRRRHFASQLFGTQENLNKIGTLAQLIDRVEEVLENEISNAEDLKNLEGIKLKARAMSFHVGNLPSHSPLPNSRAMKRQLSFSHKVTFY